MLVCIPDRVKKWDSKGRGTKKCRAREVRGVDGDWRSGDKDTTTATKRTVVVVVLI